MSRSRSTLLPVSLLLALSVLAFFATGCRRLAAPPEKVYVCVRRTYLRDRVAAVSNRTAEVLNGQTLTVLEHGRRFLRVRTPDGKTGWIEDHLVIDQKTYDAFQKLATDNRNDPVTATAVLDDQLYMHVSPGRDTDHFYLLPANSKVTLLIRASVPKSGQAPASLARLAEAAPQGASAKGQASGPQQPPPPPMEDWWLARDAKGNTGWMLASRLYIDVPDAIAEYGEGQDFVGAWKIATINDPQSDAPNHEVPEYLTVMAPPQSGLPFDFNQVRIFTWSRNHHRYETGFRLHPIQGFLPVKIFTAPGPKGSEVPAFSFLLGYNDNVKVDPETGVARPVNPRTIEYELIDTQVKRIGPDMAPIEIRHEGEKRAAKKLHHPARHKRR